MHPLTRRIQSDLRRAANPANAGPMQAYMKTSQPFHGVKAPQRREMFRAAARAFPTITRAEWETVIRELWQGTHREEMLQSLEVAEYYNRFHDEQAWPLFEYLVDTATHWDTLDWIAGKIVSRLIQQHRPLERHLLRWSRSKNMWMRRASLLAHLKHKKETNTSLLGQTILKLAHEKEFFIRKAIGWVLREYSKTDPEWVRSFVDENRSVLSPLSLREATKWLQ